MKFMKWAEQVKNRLNWKDIEERAKAVSQCSTIEEEAVEEHEEDEY